ncbi:MAG TPA: DEAD/DEAH box helicase [Burkholderiaceae bacterium]|nr:DEAD/DEAH box helicase [Burkholderiaceae bacterium]
MAQRPVVSLRETLQEPDLVVPLLDAQAMPVRGGGCAFTSLHDPVLVAALRSIGGTYHRHAKAWAVECGTDDLLGALEERAGVAAGYVFVHDTTVTLEELASAPASPLPISVPALPTHATPAGAGREASGSAFLSVLGEPLKRLPISESALGAAAVEFGLRDYQVGGVRHLLSHSSALLADDMGLGKTRQAIVAAHLAAAADAKILIVCPASLRINWAREIARVRPSDAIAMVGDTPLELLRGMRWLIANYERLAPLVRARELPIGVMVIDEAHYLKEHQSGRTRNAFLLAERAPRRFLVTGTPVLNREIEMHTLLRLAGHPIGAIPLAEFRAQFAGDAGRRAQLAERVGEWMLRRSKGVLKDLGRKIEQVCHVDPGDALARYHAALADKALNVMPKIVKLRKLLESFKVDFIVERLVALASADKAIVFCEYLETVELLLNALRIEHIGAVSLIGSDAPARRQQAVDAFQSDGRVRVFVGTTMAAGVGITLTAANWVIFGSLPWTPGLKRQAEDRAYRSGQTRDVNVLVPVVPNTIDEQVYALLGAKQEIEREVVRTIRAAS